MEVVKLVVLRALQTFIVLGAVVIGLGIAVWLYPPLFPWGLAQLDRSPFCGREEVFSGSQRRFDLIRAIGTVQGGLRLIETDGEGYELWRTGVGEFWIPERHVGALSISIAEQRVDLYGGASFRVREGDVVLDCNAEVGTYVREALVTGASKVIALEYDPRLRESLRRNFKGAIEQGQVIVYPDDPAAGAARRGGLLQPAVLEAEAVSPETLATAKIDTLLEALRIERVDVIKMSTHGIALSVLAGARNTIRKHRPRLAVTTQESEDDENEIAEWITALDLGYQPECRVCGIGSEFVIRPDVVLFQTPAL